MKKGSVGGKKAEKIQIRLNRPAKILNLKKKQKRGPKNPFLNGKTSVYHFSKKNRSVKALGNASIEIAQSLKEVSKFFMGKHVTSNIIEQQFSSLKQLINFRGKRSLNAWNSIFTFYFTMREFPGAAEKVINDLKIAPRITHRSPNLVLRLLKLANRIESKLIKVEVLL